MNEKIRELVEKELSAYAGNRGITIEWEDHVAHLVYGRRSYSVQLNWNWYNRMISRIDWMHEQFGESL